MSWIDKLVVMHEELESPKSFWYWSGLAALSAVVKDNVYLDKYAYKLYPNIYVMLHADSGLKKGPPVALAKDLVNRTKSTRVISGRSSIQGILKHLGTAFTIPGGQVVTSSTAFIVASEFSSSLVSDPAAMTILTDLYDRHYNPDDYKSLLKMEEFTLKNPTITLLVATNEAHFEDFIAAKDIHGGFIGRMFVIAEHETNTLNPLIHPPTVAPNKDELTAYLNEIAKLKGPFETLHHKPAGDMYHDWYMNFYQTIKEKHIKDETGTIQRFGDSVLKVAILLSLAEKPDLVISEHAMQSAITVCERLIGDVRKTTMGKKGQSSYANVKTMIINELYKRDPHQITRTQLSKKLWMHVNANELDEIMRSFDDAGMIKVVQMGNQIVYEMPEVYVKKMTDYLQGKNK